MISFTELIALVASVGAISGLIQYFFQRRVANSSIVAAVEKTNKEIEQIEQETENRYSLQVKKWLEELEVIKQKHDDDQQEKNKQIRSLDNQRIFLLRETEDCKNLNVHLSRAIRRLFVHLDIPFWECGKDGKLVFANGSWLKLFGLTNQDAMGEGWLTVIPEEDRDKLLVEWYGKVVDQSDSVLSFTIINPVTHVRTEINAIYVVVMNSKGDVEKIFGAARVMS